MTKEITPQQLKERVQRLGPVVGLQGVKAEAVFEVIDKDGNVKGRFNVSNEVKSDATE